MASAAEYIRYIHTQGPDAQASAGMYAFGDMLLFMSVFGAVSLFPTGLALYFLRLYQKFWTILNIATVIISATGIFAVSVLIFAKTQPSGSSWGYLAAISVLRVLPAPLIAFVFILLTAFAPIKKLKWIFGAISIIEGSIAIWAFYTWFLGSVYM